MKFETLARLVELCRQKGVRQAVISPGSRSAPLTIAFARHPAIKCRVILDERAAGFIALGIAQQTHQPVALICTSGTAALNYGPAVAEAFYQEIPLLVFTADRPPEWIDQQDGQTLHQRRLYGAHCRGSFELSVEDSHPEARWHLERLVAEAIHRATWPTPGPVQLNVPLREPLYPGPNQVSPAGTALKVINLVQSEPALTQETWVDLIGRWREAERKLVIAGLGRADDRLSEALRRLQGDPSVTVIGDIAANIHQTGTWLPHADIILGAKSAETLARLRPNLVVSFGGPVISKYLKLFLRKYPPQSLWQLRPDGQVIDTYQALTEVIPVQPLYFFEQLVRRQGSFDHQQPASYQGTWLALERQAAQLMADFLRDVPFGEFAAVAQVMRALPDGSHLQLGNSMPIRYASFIGLGAENGPANLRVNANRGVSGIDGTLSTAVGAALATGRLTTLITGDLAFFYDRNGLWHRHVPANLRVVILNNGGGGIFKLIDGPNKLPAEELETYFFTPQPLTAQNTAADHGCAYFRCNNAAGLADQLPAFFAPQSKPAILEIETDSTVNMQVFADFKAKLASLS